MYANGGLAAMTGEQEQAFEDTSIFNGLFDGNKDEYCEGGKSGEGGRGG